MTSHDQRKIREELTANLKKLATGWTPDAAPLGAGLSPVPAFQKLCAPDSGVCVVPSTSLSRTVVLAAPPLALQDRMVAEAAASALPADAGHGVPPLHWWRRLPAPAFTDLHAATIRSAIAGISIINEPCWATASRGDPAAAVGVALRAIKRRRTPSPCFDLVMSALLRCAIEGSTTAALVLEYALLRMTAEDPACSAVAASWQTATVALQPHRTLKGAALGVEVGR